MITSVFALQSPLLAARDQGFFASEGINIQYVRTRSSREQSAALLSGEVDVVQTAADNVVALATQRLNQARVFHVADLGIDQFALGSKSVSRLEDLRGRRVGVDAADSGYAFVLYKLLEDHGVGPGEYEVIEIGGPGGRYSSLLEGSSDIGLLNPHFADEAVSAGLPVLAECADRFPLYPNLVFAATPEVDGDRHDELVAYARAISAAVRWVNEPANTEQTIDLIQAESGINRDKARMLYEKERELSTGIRPDAAATRASLQVITELRNDMTGQLVPVDDFVFPWVIASQS